MLDRFLYLIAGVDSELMKLVSGKERNKYMTIGGTILFTGTIAGLSCGFAVYTLVGSLSVAASIGSLWGSGIILLDKAFVAGIDKKKDSFKVQIFKAIPRIFLSCTLGFIIGQPIAVLISQSAIKIEIKERQKLAYQDELKGLQKRNDEVTEPAKKKTEKNIEELSKKLCGQGQCVGAREAYNNATRNFNAKNGINEQYQNLQSQIKATELQLQAVNNELKSLSNGDTIQLSSGNTPDLFYQWGIFNSLVNKNPDIFKLDVLITMLFVLIETCPLLLKLMSESGSYDQLIADQELTVKISSRRENRAKMQKIKDEYDAIKYESSREKEAKKQQADDESETIQYKSGQEKKAKQELIDSEFKIQQEIRVEMLKKSKLEFGQLLAQRFKDVIEKVSDVERPEARTGFDQAIRVIDHRVNQQMINQASLIEFSSKEIEERLNIIKEMIIEQKLQKNVEQGVTEALIERFQREDIREFEDEALKNDHLNLEDPDMFNSSNSNNNKDQPKASTNHATQSNRPKRYSAFNFESNQHLNEDTTNNGSLNGKIPN